MTGVSQCIYTQGWECLLLALSLLECSPLEVAQSLNDIGRLVRVVAHDIGRQVAVNQVNRVKHLGYGNKCQARTCGSALPDYRAWRLLLLHSLRRCWVFMLRRRHSSIFLADKLSLVLLMAYVCHGLVHRLWIKIRGLLSPFRSAEIACLKLIVIKNRLLLSQLLLKLLCNLALEAVKCCAETIYNFCGAEAITSGVVWRVHWILNNKVALVHLRQLIEWPIKNI